MVLQVLVGLAFPILLSKLPNGFAKGVAGMLLPMSVVPIFSCLPLDAGKTVDSIRPAHIAHDQVRPHGECHLSLFAPLPFQCQPPCQSGDRGPQPQGDRERRMNLLCQGAGGLWTGLGWATPSGGQALIRSHGPPKDGGVDRSLSGRHRRARQPVYRVRPHQGFMRVQVGA